MYLALEKRFVAVAVGVSRTLILRLRTGDQLHVLALHLVLMKKNLNLRITLPM